MRIRRTITTAATGAVVASLALSAIVLAATTVRVTQNTASWTQDDTRPGGSVTFTEAYGAPAGLGDGSLELATTLSTTAKAGLYTHTMLGTPLDDVTDLAYWTFQAVTAPPNPPIAAASYQLQLDTDGTLGDGMGFTTLVYEPYWNPLSPLAVAPGVWQQWDVDAGLMWSSRTTSCGLVAGAGGPPLYTLAAVKALCPAAVVVGIGVNVGSNNPGYTVATDGVRFNDTIYDFELGRRPGTKDDCKDDGWRTFNDPSFRNQGQCVKYVNHS